MINDSKQCDPCPWPLNCCTEDGAPKPGTVAADCPREHDVWQRRLSDALALTSSSPVALVAVAEDEEQELVGV